MTNLLDTLWEWYAATNTSAPKIDPVDDNASILSMTRRPAKS